MLLLGGLWLWVGGRLLRQVGRVGREKLRIVSKKQEGGEEVEGETDEKKNCFEV